MEGVGGAVVPVDSVEPEPEGEDEDDYKGKGAGGGAGEGRKFKGSRSFPTLFYGAVCMREVG